MSTPAPETDAGVLISPFIDFPAPSPDNEIVSPPAPAFTLPISIPTIAPFIAPTLPIVVGHTPSPPPFFPPILPPPTLPPTFQPEPEPKPGPESKPESHPHPQPQPRPQPPLTSPIGPPPEVTGPPPDIVGPSPISSSDPIIPFSPPSPPVSSRRPKTQPATHIGPSKRSPLRPKTNPPSHTIPLSPKTNPPSLTGPIRPKTPLPTSAVLPTPPVPLPVPQSPGGGAWIPFSTESPTPLPILPGPPGKTLSSPVDHVHGSNSGASALPSSGDHQNIQAAAVSPKGSNNGASGFVVGLAVGGVLLLLLGAVFGILFAFCKKRDKKKIDDYGSGRKHATIFSGFEEKSSLPQYTKQGSNNTQVLHNMNNIATPKSSNMGATNETSPTFVGPSPSPGKRPSFSSGTFTYNELMRATNGFSEQNLLGQGGFGYVHKGVLPNGKEVAVKQLKMGGHQGEREFRAEVETISQVHHKHLVSLVGYCIAGAERLLVYEFVPNNTMDFHLHGKEQQVMDWPTRLKIAIGSAKGLAYLHEDCSPTIIHRDIKAANILLDFNFEAKVSDFGLAKIFSSTNPSVTHITTRVVGTFGYLAPEYASSGKVTDKTDVYSYGVMLLELITGRPPISNFGSGTNGSLVNWARPLLAQAIGDGKFDSLADPKLESNYNVDEMASMVACAAACVRLSAWRRPRMSQVVRALEGNLPTSELDDGTRPGQSGMHFPYESLDFDARNYMEDLKKMALTSYNGYTTTTSRYSDNTSEYGLIPSDSSSNTSHPSVLRD